MGTKKITRAFGPPTGDSEAAFTQKTPIPGADFSHLDPQKRVPSSEVQRFAQEMLKRNVTLLTGRFYQRPEEEESDEHAIVELAPNPQDIRRVVERNIIPEYDHPRIIDAVTEYLYNRIWMT